MAYYALDRNGACQVSQFARLNGYDAGGYDVSGLCPFCVIYYGELTKYSTIAQINSHSYILTEAACYKICVQSNPRNGPLQFMTFFSADNNCYCKRTVLEASSHIGTTSVGGSVLLSGTCAIYPNVVGASICQNITYDPMA